jgi:general secretion pathway protein C
VPAVLVLALLLALADAPPPDLRAAGVVISPQADHCVAVLSSGTRTRVVRPGQPAFGGQVRRIERDSVVIEYGSGEVVVELEGKARKPTLTPIASPPATITSTPKPRVMERREVEARLAQEVGRITAETTLAPVTEAGQIHGFVLRRIPEGTLLTDVGLRAGDVLESINGTPIDSLATLMSLWTRLQGESSLRAEVVRNGQPLSLELTLR